MSTSEPIQETKHIHLLEKADGLGLKDRTLFELIYSSQTDDSMESNPTLSMQNIGAFMGLAVEHLGETGGEALMQVIYDAFYAGAWSVLTPEGKRRVKVSWETVKECTERRNAEEPHINESEINKHYQ